MAILTLSYIVRDYKQLYLWNQSRYHFEICRDNTFMTLSVCDGFDVCHVLPWQRLLGRLKIEQYSQIVELGIEICENETFSEGY